MKFVTRCFNIGRHIATIQSTNVNLGICNAKITGNGDIQLSHVMCIDPNVLNAIVLTRLNTIGRWYSVFFFF